MDLPGTSGVAVERTDFVPDGARAMVIRLRLRALRDTRLDLMVHAHSELMGAYPWGETEPSQLDYNLRDEVSFRRRRARVPRTGQAGSRERLAP